MNTTIHDLFDLTLGERAKIWEYLIHKLDRHIENPESVRVSPVLDREKIISEVSEFDSTEAINHKEAIDTVLDGLGRYIVHTTHPSYFGLFNPRATFPGIIADVITATFNPQMAAWSHAPFATEAENYSIREMGKKVGYAEENIDGTFCSGGAEANLTAVLCALVNKFPEYLENGLRALPAQPLVYCSDEAHHSINRAVRVSGLGFANLKSAPVNESRRVIPTALRDMINEDLANGLAPFMLVANAGATGTGAIDPLEEMAAIAREFGLWFHIDAAYGGAAVIDEELKNELSGIELGDSLTIDIHKWYSAPMATSIFMTNHKEILGKTFRITADYMPKEARNIEIEDPYAHSLQWSRRFIGLKFYLSLLMLGWEGLTKMIRSTTEIGEYLRHELRKEDWMILNDTPFPIVCFSDPELMNRVGFEEEICSDVVASGEAWISTYRIGNQTTLRACITNYRTSKKEIDDLVGLIGHFRNKYYSKA